MTTKKAQFPLRVVILWLVTLTITIGAGGRPASAATPNSLGAGAIPLVFEVNRGQAVAPVRFIARRPGHTLLLTSDAAFMILDSHTKRAEAIRMRFEGSHAGKIEGQSLLPGKVNYLTGRDPRAFQTDIPLYAQVAYRQLYPSVDLVMRGGAADQLEYDFMIAPGGNPSGITMKFEGARRTEIDEHGDLRLITNDGVLVQRAPVAYQVIGGKRQHVESRFIMRKPGSVGFEVGTYDSRATLVIDPPFAYSTYIGGDGTDHVRAIATDAAGAVYVTGETNSLAGLDALDFPTMSPFPGGEQLGSYSYPPPASRPHPLVRKFDGFIGKFDTTQSGAQSLVYMSFFGGALGDEQPQAITVDSSGRAYFGGMTSSQDLPLVNPLQSCHDASNAFVCDFNISFLARVSASGAALEYSSYLNGSNVDEVSALAIGPQNRLYVGGRTASPISPILPVLPSSPNYFSYFPLTPTAIQTTNHGNFDAFLMVLDTMAANPAQQLVYSTLLGGCANDEVHDIAVDSQGRAAISGTTQNPCANPATVFPLVNAYQSVYAGGLTDTFVASVSPAISGIGGLNFSTFLGGIYDENDLRKSGLALDAAGNIHVAGTTSSPNFPTTPGAFQRCPGMSAANAATYPCDSATGQFLLTLPPNGVVGDGYMATFSPSGQLLHSTFIGGAGQDQIQDIAIRQDGNYAYVVGATNSTGLGSVCAPQSQLKLGRDAFQATIRLTPQAGGGLSSALTFFTYIGGGADDFGTTIAFDSVTNSVFVGGYTTFNTSSFVFPTTQNALQPVQPGSSTLPYENGFLTQITNPVGCVPDLVLTKSGSPEPASPGCALNYTLQVKNTGVLQATQVTITDPLPAPFNLLSANSTQGTCSGTNPVVCNIGTLGIGQTATVTLTGTLAADYAPGGPPLVNTANAASLETDANPSDNTASWTTQVQSNNPGYSVSGPTVVEGDTGTTPAIFTVTLTQAACLQLQFTYQTAMVNDPAVAAQSGTDFLPANGTFFIPAGSTTYDVPVTVVPDILVEPNEQFDLVVAANFSGPVSTASASATIINDDAPPVVSLTGPMTVNEGGTYLYSFQVTAKGPFIVSLANCGSGSVVGAVTMNQDPSGGGTGSFYCLFGNGPNNTQVHVQVQSGGAPSNIGSEDVTIANVAPVVMLTGVQSADAGSIVTYQFSATDAGGDAFSVSTGYPSCGAVGMLVDGSLSLSAQGGSFQCLFGSGPTTTQVAMKITDADGTDSAVATLAVSIAAPTTQYWMIGNGHLAGDVVKIAFSLSCKAGQGPKNLQVMWGVHKFRLEKLTASTCSNDPAIDPGSPATPFDTLQGSGTGRYDNGSGFLASFTFTDAGEPGLNDTARIKIMDTNGNVVLDVMGAFEKGNIDAQQ